MSLTRCRLMIHWLDAVAHNRKPNPNSGAPMEIRIEVDIHVLQTLCRFDERLFEDLTEATGTSCRCLKNVIRHAGVAARNAIKNGIERPLSAIWIAAFAGFDESLSLAHYLAFHKDDHQFFRSWIKELAWHCDQSGPLAKLNSRPTPTEPEISAWPSRLAARSESTNSICRTLLSSKARVRNT